MNEPLKCIFVNASENEVTSAVLSKMITMQSKTSKKVIVLSIFAMAYVFVSEKRFATQQTLIEKMSRELKELTQKGE